MPRNNRGWTVIPMKIGAKKPALCWKAYQTRRPPDSYVRRWFNRPNRGIAVVFGQASQNLGSRDFDDLLAYGEWAAENPELASSLPTVETRRGRHVYFQFDPADMQEIRKSLGKPHGNGAIACGDGELRAGDGCYSLVPPSYLPPTNGLPEHTYRWLIPPDEMPIVDIRAAGLLKKRLVTERTEWDGGLQRVTEEMVVDGVISDEKVMFAVSSTLPTAPGQRHRQVFELCRALKADPRLAGLSPKELKPLIRVWHRLALPAISTKPFEETYADFISAWPSVKFAKGADPITDIWKQAMQRGLPAAALDYDGDEIRRLVALCRELQRTSGSEPFYLSCRTAAELLDVSHVQANRWLRVLIEDQVIQEVTKGNRNTGKASRYRYLAEF